MGYDDDDDGRITLNIEIIGVGKFGNNAHGQLTQAPHETDEIDRAQPSPSACPGGRGLRPCEEAPEQEKENTMIKFALLLGLVGCTSSDVSPVGTWKMNLNWIGNSCFSGVGSLDLDVSQTDAGYSATRNLAIDSVTLTAVTQDSSEAGITGTISNSLQLLGFDAHVDGSGYIIDGHGYNTLFNDDGSINCATQNFNITGTVEP